MHCCFSLVGNLNSMSFDEETLLLKGSTQNITGRVSFGTRAETMFKALEVRGLVNNADIEKLVQNQVCIYTTKPYFCTFSLYGNWRLK